MKQLLIIILAIVLFDKSSAQSYNGVSKETFDLIVNKTNMKLSKGGYLWCKKYHQAKLIDSTSTLKGWKGRKLYIYNYTVTDSKPYKSLNTNVILYNPTAEKLTKWAINAIAKNNTVNKKKIKLNLENINSIIDYIIAQSGGQFPVRGIVYEDISPQNGIQETYVFFDGVTVEHTDAAKYRIIAPQRATKEQEKAFWNMSFEDIDDKQTKGKARISSTLREEYSKLFDVDTKGRKWVEIVRNEYQKAMDTDFNNLIYCTIVMNDELKKKLK